MQTTTTNWRELMASADGPYVQTIPEVYVNGTQYEIVGAPVVSRTLTQSDRVVGNCVAATLQISLRTTADLPKSALVELYARIKAPGAITGPTRERMGKYYISRREVHPETGVTTLLCYDAMLKADAPYVPANVPSGGIYMYNAYFEIAQAMGLSTWNKDALALDEAYMLTEFPASQTMRDVLAKIAAVNGGNIFITPEGYLRFIRLKSAENATAATEDVVDILGIIGDLAVSPAVTITGFRWMQDGEEQLTGTDTGLVVDLTDAPMNSAIATNLSSTLIGITYQPYTASSAIYDLAAELGDYVRRQLTVDGTTTTYISGILCAETVSYCAAARGTLSAPSPPEFADEYPFLGGATKTLAEAKEYTDALSDSMDQQDIFNRLTDNGAAQGFYLYEGQLYINASYLQTGVLNADVVRIINLSADDIASGIIHSADYTTVAIPYIYPASTLYPGAEVYCNNGELVTKGFAIDFTTGQIYGGFYSEQIAQLQNALVYPKDAPSRSRGGAEEESEER